MKKIYTSPVITVVETDGCLMEDYSERTEQFSKEHQDFDFGPGVGKSQDYINHDSWLDYTDYGTDIKKNSEIHY